MKDDVMKLVSDVFAAIARAETVKGGGGSADADDNSASRFNSMRISELWQLVHDNRR